MTTEEKQLLLKDLCSRLPYGVMYKTPYGPRVLNDIFIYSNGPVYTDHGVGNYNEVFGVELENIKPYLRPLSSMTEEECTTLSKLIPYETDAWKYIKTPVPLYIANIEQFDFFHRHHLDWRGLIPKGLALEAPEGMYKTE